MKQFTTELEEKEGALANVRAWVSGEGQNQAIYSAIHKEKRRNALNFHYCKVSLGSAAFKLRHCSM